MTKSSDFTFTDRDTYLIWRQDWRREYAQLVAEIRQEKAKRKQFFWSKADNKSPRIKTGVNPQYDAFANGNLSDLRKRAHAMMESRVEATQLATKQRAANKL